MITIPKAKKRSPQSQLQLPTDPLKAYRMGHADGFDDATIATLNLMILAFLDNGLMEKDNVGLFMDRFKSLLATVNAKNMDINDVKKVLKSEYDIKLTLK